VSHRENAAGTICMRESW